MYLFHVVKSTTYSYNKPNNNKIKKGHNNKKKIEIFLIIKNLATDTQGNKYKSSRSKIKKINAILK